MPVLIRTAPGQRAAAGGSSPLVRGALAVLGAVIAAALYAGLIAPPVSALRVLGHVSQWYLASAMRNSAIAGLICGAIIGARRLDWRQGGVLTGFAYYTYRCTVEITQDLLSDGLRGEGDQYFVYALTCLPAGFIAGAVTALLLGRLAAGGEDARAE